MTGAVALRVYVTRKLPAEELARADHIPGRVEGWRTDVVSALAAVATSADDVLAPVEPGLVISNLRGVFGGDATQEVLGLGTRGRRGGRGQLAPLGDVPARLVGAEQRSRRHQPAGPTGDGVRQ
jgi:hypothetical protein